MGLFRFCGGCCLGGLRRGAGSGMQGGMDAKTYWRWSVEVPAAAADGVCEWVRAEFGEEPVCRLEPGAETARVEVYFGAEAGAQAAAERVEGSRVERVGEESWTGFWKDHFRVTPIGRTLQTVPVWADAPENGRISLRVDPGLSFGTGGHFTTRFCLEALEEAVEQVEPRSMLDAGAGSGILSIAAALWGVEKVEGFDCDPVSVERCGANAALNGLAAGRIRFRRQDVREWRPEGRWDVVCANILSGILVECAGALWAATGRRLIASGIRTVEGDEVAAAFEAQGARVGRRESDGEWCGLVLVRE